MLSETAEEGKDDKGHYHINASNPLEVTLSTQTVGFWAGMAGNNAPTDRSALGGGWPVYEKANPQAMVFGDFSPLPAVAKANVRTAKCDFWDAQFAKVLAAGPGGRPGRAAAADGPF